MSTEPKSAGLQPTPGMLLAGGLLAVVLAWSYAAPMAMLVGRWWNEPDYLYGFLVPVFSGWLLWHRRELLAGVTPKGSWWGLAFLAVAAAMRWASAYYFFALLDPLSVVPCLLGVVLFVGGWRVLWWAGPSVVFLGFMVPLPGFAAGLLGHQLQRVGTIVSTYVLQTMGIPAIAHGNVIRLTEAELGVVEACSGLRMMMLFVTVCVGAAMVMKSGILEKVIVVLSAAPIAVVANVIRISVTGVLHETAGQEIADAVFHDLAGWFMMPIAVLLLWGEMWLLAKILPPVEESRPLEFKLAPSEGVVPGRRSGPRRRNKSQKR